MKKHIGMTGKAVAAVLTLAVAATTPATAAPPEPFKITNIHFETNASACDMGIQISFDTGGVSEGWVKDPNGQVVYQFGAVGGAEVTHNITEGFQERVEPQIVELEQALGCERDAEEPEIFLTELLSAWPEGKYIFGGQNADTNFRGFAKLSHKLAAGPEIVAPADGDVVSADEHLLIRWKKVTEPIMPGFGPVEIVGYHVLLADITSAEPAPGKTKIQFDADVPQSTSSFLVAKQFLRPNRIYELEILATEKGGNQTITEGGVFCTRPITPAACVKP